MTRGFAPIAPEGKTNIKTGFLTAIALSLALAATARAADNSWTDGSGKWETTNNWSRLLAPSLNDTADLITNTSTKTVTIDLTTAGSGTMTISNLTVSAPLNSTNTLSLNNAGVGTPLDVLNSFTIASGGALLITNSVLRVDGVSGGSVAVDGTVVVNGGTIITTNLQTSVGSSGVGQMTVFNGTVQARNVVVGANSGSQGTLTMHGGTMLVSSNLLVGSLSNVVGRVAVSGGSLFLTNAAHSAVTEVRYGTLTLTTGGVFVTDSLLITNASGSFINNGGTFSITGQAQVDQGTQTFASGTSVLSSNFVVGSSANSTGTVNITGGQLIITNGVFGIGNNGSSTNGTGVGRVTVTNGALLASTVLLGSTAGGKGSLIIQSGGSVSFPGSNSLLSVNSVTVEGGADPVGELDIVNGTIKVGVTVNGTMTVDGGIAQCADVFIGEDALGTCHMTAGTLTMSSVLTVGDNPSSTGIIWMDDGNWLSSSRAMIGNNGVGQMTISNGIMTLPRVVLSGISASPNPGTLTVAGGAMFSTNLVVGFDVNSTGTVWVTGGELDVTNIAANAPLVIGRFGRGACTLSNGTVVVDQLLVTNSTKSSFSFVGGTLKTRSTSVTNTAQFVVGDGTSPATLNLLGGVHSFANGLRIHANATLSGCGTISGNVVVDSGGTVLADCGGTLTFTDGVANDGTMRAINGTTLEFYSGPVVNNGLIDVINGNTNLHGVAFSGNGTVLDASSVKISQVSKSGPDMVIRIPSVTGHTYQLQFTTSLAPAAWTNTGTSQSGNGLVLTFTDPGGAANPQRFYRVDVTAL